MKYKRQNQIIKIVRSMPVHTHEELIDALGRDGFFVTQATVSRDIKELGLIKIPASDGGSVYSVADRGSDSITRAGMLSDSVKRVVSACHTVVINTHPGMAPAVAAAVDAAIGSEILGSVAGDDTVLIIAESAEKAAAIEARLKIEFRAE